MPLSSSTPTPAISKETIDTVTAEEFSITKTKTSNSSYVARFDSHELDYTIIVKFNLKEATTPVQSISYGERDLSGYFKSNAETILYSPSSIKSQNLRAVVDELLAKVAEEALAAQLEKGIPRRK